VPVYCRWTPAERSPFFRNPVSSHDQHPVAAEVLQNVGADLVTHLVSVPAGVPQQPLHRARARMPGVFGQLPAVLALDAGHQPEQVGAGGRPGLNPPEPARDPGHGLVEHRLPADRVYTMARVHRTIFRSPHKPR
jgi:hypothetical protein